MNITPQQLNVIDKSTVTESMCVAKIKKLGYDACIAHMGAYDVVMDVNGILLRVQVKSSIIKKSAPDRPGYGYHFSITRGSKVNKRRLTSIDCDILAFAAFERERVFFKHISEHNGNYTKRFPKEYFDDPDIMGIERESLNKALLIHKNLLEGK
jgi:hypothetical protein